MSQEVTETQLHKNDNILIKLLSETLILVTIIFGFYIHIHGDIIPGGGFQSGAIIASAIFLKSFLKIKTSKRVLKNNTLTKISIFGFILYIVMASISLFYGKSFFNYNINNSIISNQIGVFIVEIAIALIVFSAIMNIISTLLKILNSSEIFKSI